MKIVAIQIVIILLLSSCGASKHVKQPDEHCSCNQVTIPIRDNQAAFSSSIDYAIEVDPNCYRTQFHVSDVYLVSVNEEYPDMDKMFMSTIPGSELDRSGVDAISPEFAFVSTPMENGYVVPKGQYALRLALISLQEGLCVVSSNEFTIKNDTEYFIEY